ncbi:DUF3011 domain-containing protein [Stenotrophomonas indicatrix]|jgi:hypothetical protein|uniref:DUF3011 domain-containing protein n=1 Tax=Stenotrophomonas TaxID=40323 RepID=UPI00092B5075|nr:MULTISPECIES: DUF3011 domain-containing protein [Stenotrophomonas]MBA0098034.1 DUF3011 domain-containing protein [Stenotrophomonas indicatrix]OJH80379.1 MAG: hypothetical protein BSK19_08965 [Stenotrophomonas maltophilia]PII16530.1 hypothetical protein CR920_12360 [Stenotrophomonas indicatrix]QBR45305.1 hypothetical protein DAIF1_28840 [Stenotrophomonas indicatrix]
MGKGLTWRTVACTLLPMMAAAGGVQAQNYGYDDRYDDRGGNGIVRCESIKNRSNECRLEGRARMIRQLSGSPCVEGETWGQSRYGVWVTQGCRAEFVGEYRRPGGGGGGWGGGGGNGWGGSQWGGGGQVIACHSNDRRQQYCDAQVRRGVRLVRQESRSACIEGQTWGWDRRGIWVSNGCRAQFQVN